MVRNEIRLDTARKNLMYYAYTDVAYSSYIKSGKEPKSEFDKFCVSHCKDIMALIKENDELKNTLEKYKKGV